VRARRKGKRRAAVTPSRASSPLVSIIVINWNGGAQMLCECLDSVMAQTHRAIEPIVVDNGSRDGSIEAAIEKFGDRVRVLRNEANLGFARANNQGFEIAKGDWILLLNNDAVLDPRAVEELMAFAKDRPRVGMLACRVMRHDAPNFFDSVGLLLYPDGVCRSRGWEEKDIGQYDRPEEVLAPNGCAAVYRKEMIAETGCFDDSYFMYLEDLDLGLRGQLCGWSCWYVPTAVVYHRKSTSAGNYSRAKAYLVERNRIWNAIKLMPRFILLVSPFFSVNRYLLQAYAAWTNQGLSGKFVKEYSFPELAFIMARSYAAAFLRVPEMFAKRQALSRKRRISTEEWYRLISRFKLDAIELALKA
jgi:GT2 family glycosyltransferase